MRTALFTGIRSWQLDGELRFFGGMTLEQGAECLNICHSTADCAWRYAREWAYTAMAGGDSKKNNFPMTCFGPRRRISE